MRIAVLIIGLVLSFGLFWQAFIVSILSDIGDDEPLSSAAAVGVLMGFMWLVACGFVIPKPRISAIIFALAALFGFVTPSAGYEDLPIWAGMSVVLAVMSYLGYRGKMKDQAKQQERDELMRRALMMHQQPATPSAITCPACGSLERPSARFCGSCGAALGTSRP